MTRPAFPTQIDVLQAWLEEFGRELHTSFPARVQSYDATNQVADLVPLVRHPVPQADDSVVYEDLPVLPHVPIVFPRTGRWFLSLPIAVGDLVLVVCCESAIGHWHASDGGVTYPGDLRRFDLSHAVALPGLFPQSKALANASATDLVIGDDQGSRITLKPDGTVEIAGNAAFVALANLVNNALSTIRTTFNAHVHTGVSTGVGSSGPPATPLVSLPDVSASKVKAV